MAPLVPPTVEISDSQKCLTVDRHALKQLAERVCALENLSGGSISVALVDDPSIHEINRRFLDHDWPTDVITFDLREPGQPEPAGEIVISTETARRVAAAAGVDASAELALYLVHGLLHLSGHDDLDDQPRAQMRRREAELMQELGIPHPGASPADGLHGPPDLQHQEAHPWVD